MNLDNHGIGVRELRWAANLFEGNIYFLCSKDQSLQSSANSVMPIAPHALATGAVGSSIVPPLEPRITLIEASPALLSDQVLQPQETACVTILVAEKEEFSPTDDLFHKRGNSIQTM